MELHTDLKYFNVDHFRFDYLLITRVIFKMDYTNSHRIQTKYNLTMEKTHNLSF